jgi:hypothetical protein
MKQISLSLTRGLAQEDSAALLEAFNNNEFLLDNVKRTLKEKSAENKTKQISHALFDNPSWPYYQAHMNGYQKAIEEIIELLTLRDEVRP